MADRIVETSVPAVNLSLATTDEIKNLIGIPLADLTQDTSLTVMIEVASAVIMRACNRIFAYETLTEEWDWVFNGRIMVSHFPLVKSDITSVVDGSGTTLGVDADFKVEEWSGKLENKNGWVWPVTVSYSGGYNLPDEAPLPLKYATSILVRDMIIQATRQSMQGIRSITHKEARVMFFDYVKPQWAKGVLALGTGNPDADALLVHYVRLEV
jgi:hypothetical protein